MPGVEQPGPERTPGLTHFLDRASSGSLPRGLQVQEQEQVREQEQEQEQELEQEQEQEQEQEAMPVALSSPEIRK